jgi:hypothetical protein
LFFFLVSRRPLVPGSASGQNQQKCRDEHHPASPQNFPLTMHLISRPDRATIILVWFERHHMLLCDGPTP